MAVPEVSAQPNIIGTRKPKPDGTKVKMRIFANLAVKGIIFLENFQPYFYNQDDYGVILVFEKGKIF